MKHRGLWVLVILMCSSMLGLGMSISPAKSAKAEVPITAKLYPVKITNLDRSQVVIFQTTGDFPFEADKALAQSVSRWMSQHRDRRVVACTHMGDYDKSGSPQEGSYGQIGLMILTEPVYKPPYPTNDFDVDAISGQNVGSKIKIGPAKAKK